MRLQTAFLLGVLVGHWIVLLALWSATLKLVKMLISADAGTNHESSQQKEIIYLPTGDFSYKE